MASEIQIGELGVAFKASDLPPRGDNRIAGMYPAPDGGKRGGLTYCGKLVGVVVPVRDGRMVLDGE